ncbi:MAG: ATP-dependent zinc protease [Phycisphaeraceae bacterium]|nr:MAG: ATP-dependent zinc protease [Phycisphaeraceae bacterium]
MAGEQTLPVIGWRERVDLPEWGLRRVRAKIDTGARTSAIDVAQVEDLGDGRIRFEVVGRKGGTPRTVWVEARPVRTSVVKPSHGETQERYVCLTPIRIGALEREVEISLVCRKHMLCRMLIGRLAVGGLATVDPARKYVATPKRKTVRREESEG